MAIDYKQWCEQNADVRSLVRALKSSMPEQYIGFYLEKAFPNKIEYQKQFDWLGNYSLDMYIPSMKLAIEYDGAYYHAKKKADDRYKTALCKANGIFVVHIIEQKVEQPKSRKRNEISYYFQKNYKNIDIAISELFRLISKKFNMCLLVDVDLNRDRDEIISYVQLKFYQRSMAYVWPESRDYWIEEENGLTPFDILSTDTRWLSFKCPHCGLIYRRHMRWYTNRKSLVPCECELEEIEQHFNEAIQRYKDNGEIVMLDKTLQSRRLYDRMANVVDRIWHCGSNEEAELYKKLGFDSEYIDVYLNLCKDKEALN
jgi:very-short-patch-repair endonuclease/predicted RNA-binding Zn-ribbon protein involved in translation (DUF1610 family)